MVIQEKSQPCRFKTGRIAKTSPTQHTLRFILRVHSDTIIWTDKILPKNH